MMIFETCCAHDRAIDPKESRFDKFILTRDMSHLKFLEGKKPTVFVLRRPPERLVRTYIKLGDPTDDHDLCVRAFRTCVLRVRNLVSYDGVDLSLYETTVGKGGIDQASIMTDDELDLFATTDVVDIGAVAYQRCFLVQGSSRLFEAPHTSQVALRQRLLHCHHADDVLRLLDQSNDEAKKGLITLLESLGVKAMDVTASPIPAPDSSQPTTQSAMS